MLEVPVVLATILQTYRLPTRVQSIPLDAAISLHPAEPLPVHVQFTAPGNPGRSPRP